MATREHCDLKNRMQPLTHKEIVSFLVTSFMLFRLAQDASKELDQIWAHSKWRKKKWMSQVLVKAVKGFHMKRMFEVRGKHSSVRISSAQLSMGKIQKIQHISGLRQPRASYKRWKGFWDLFGAGLLFHLISKCLWCLHTKEDKPKWGFAFCREGKFNGKVLATQRKSFNKGK